LALVVALAGCQPMVPRSLPVVRVRDLWTEAQCRRAQVKRDALTGVSAGLAVATGAGGIGAVFPESESYRLPLGLVSLGLGIAAAVLAPFVSSAAADLANHCVLTANN
jgi:hypothetical protein